MDSWRFPVRAALLLVFTSLVLTSCSERGTRTTTTETAPKAAVKAEAASEPVNAPEETEAMIVFMTGDVSIDGASGRRFPEIGDTAVAGESIVTGSDGYVELQFGDLGAVRINESTEYRIDAVALSDGGGRASGSLAVGSVVSKVRKLVGSDSFEIGVPGAVCAVRGTEFLIRADERGSITVAVVKGSVAVVPPSLSEAEAGPDAADEPAISEIRALMPLVGASEEIVLNQDSFVEVEAELAVWNLAETEDDRNATAEAAASKVARALEDAPVAVPITRDNEKAVQEAAAQLLTVSLATDSEAEEVPALVTLTVAVEPPDTDIYLDGRPVGRGGISRIYREGTPVEIRAVASDGRILDRSVITGLEAVVSLEFEAVEEVETEGAEISEAVETPPEAVQEEVSAETVTQAEAAVTTLSIQAVPDTAAISIDGRNRGRGSVRTEGKEGEMLTVRVEAPGFAAREQRVALNPDSPTLDIELEPRIMVNRVELPGPGTGTPAVNDRYAVIATAGGALTALSSEGEPIWIRETANGDCENTSPVIIANRAYVIGDSELVGVDLAGGRVLFRKELSGGLEDRFGRRPVAIGGRAVVPGDTVLQLVDLDTGEARDSLEIPQGSRATPARWNRRLVIADQRGTVHVFDVENRTVTASIQTSSQQPIAQAPAVSDSGRAVIVGRRGTVSAIDLPYGKVAWEKPLAGDGTVRVYTDALIAMNTAYVFGDGRLFALHMASGQDRFTPIGGVTAPPAVRGDILFLCRDDGTLTLHGATDGRLIGTIPLGEIARARPVELGDYVIVAGEKTAFVIDPRSLTDY